MTVLSAGSGRDRPSSRRRSYEIGGRGRPPLMAKHRRDVGDAGGNVGGKQIAIGPMFDAMAERVLPVIEHLAAEDVAADAPIMLVIPAFQMFVTRHQIVEIGDL